MTGPPPPGRLYWVCQFAGWGGFLTYVLGGYLLTANPQRVSDLVSIVFFNGVVCPALTHGLRYWMYTRGWLRLPLGRLLPRLTAVVLLSSAGLAAGIGLGAILVNGVTLPPAVLFWIFVGFCWALAGWLVIYSAVHARRRRDALQLELTIVARDAQLRSLRAQLNPHFLFNCLNSLRHLILVDPERAASMVTGLSELLRYSLASDRKDTVPLADELHVVDEYLDLERVRLDERLQVERAVDPEVLDAYIPPMLVQTLVDNAIKHGISDLPRGGVVRVEARLVGERVDILVANTGPLKPPAQDAGYGLHNATERLRVLYGAAASLNLREVDGMTRAELSVPYERTAR